MPVSLTYKIERQKAVWKDYVMVLQKAAEKAILTTQK